MSNSKNNETLKNIFQIILIDLFVGAIIYLAIAFIYGSVDPYVWSMEARITLTLFLLVIWFMLFMVTFGFTDSSDKGDNESVNTESSPEN
ncbi:hypothetical protein CMT56_15540 [Elizabethkingia anophelis]|nr:hypothetical protein [Elizabethkingia anophelis]MDV3861035.1 hypothetical protein [Elizabethkingia anophelis]MDV3908823.1 hypothetical protein [Elizabethkingia anophelis]MDV3925352.1 hypothetical protein [Elizabethkingia anophelis]MDV3989426.1 hypothetical protein [Elizabethkingia anophelis]